MVETNRRLNQLGEGAENEGALAITSSNQGNNHDKDDYEILIK